MMKVKPTIALALAALLSAAGMAYASAQFVQVSNIALTAGKAGRSTGFRVDIHSADPGAVQPQGLKTLTITFPAGTRFNFKSKALEQCRASDVEIKATLGAACGAKSKIGAGTAVANGAPVLPVIPETAAAFAGPNNIVILLTPAAGAGQVLVLHGVVSGNRVTATVPVLSAGGLNIVLTSLKLTVKTIGSGSRAFVTAGRCTKGKFTVRSRFLYQTGATLSLTSSSKCKK